MRRINSIRLTLSGIALAFVLYLGVRPAGRLPPLGPFLDPYRGVWAVAEAVRLSESEEIALVGLSEPVSVIIDRRGVPHIFARTSDDAARALGYVTARDRLFQMELRWRTTAGRLSELVGDAALDFDRRVRGLGLAWSAERDFAALEAEDSEVARSIRAYAEGVNAWVDAMGRGDLPLEYRLLNARPSRWEPVYSLYLLKLMGWDLSHWVTTDLSRMRLVARVGEEAANALAPAHSPIQQPIQPNGQVGPRFDFPVIPPPGAPDTAAERKVRELELAWGPFGDRVEPGHDDAIMGSNNWAVAPGRTATGYPLLAGDPHLELSLPAIWYEAHLVVPGDLDVYGVTIPSVPMIVIGFNRDVAWSFTNTGADVIDYYEERLDDEARPTRYRLDGEWRPLEFRVEEYRGRGGRLLETDTIFFTHRGPLIRRSQPSLSMRWTVLESEGETRALWDAMRATSVREWLAAIESFAAPAQNGVVADREGTIAIRSTGKFPIHPDGDGRRIRDGTTSASDWLGFWPLARYPFAIQPEQGYLASANQQPIDPRVDPTYLSANWPSPWRAIRINAILAADSAVTPDAMRRYQLDPLNARAEFFVPYFSDAVVRSSGESNTVEAIEAALLLAQWNGEYTRDNERAVLFEYAMEELRDRVWDELFERSTMTGAPITPAEEGGNGRRVFTPTTAVLAALMRQPTSVWWDDRRTAEVQEDRDVVLLASLTAAFRRARREHGEPDAGGWRWENIRHANIYHPLRAPALSALDLPIQGGPGTLNPSFDAGVHGASWRMVVELGPQVRGWSIYPGGQSGNPVSPLYKNRIGKWIAGELDAVLFPRAAADLSKPDVLSVLELRPEG